MKNKISFVIPTLNAEQVLKGCLDSIMIQDYPKDSIEIIIADGGSTDGTIELAKKYGAKVFPNSLKTAESGKAVGVKNTTGEFICLIDSDNRLTNPNWINQMMLPLRSNPAFLGSEPIRFEYRRKEDRFIDRYCALIGMNDPLCLWLGSYDKYCYLTNSWTSLSIPTKHKKGYLELTLYSGNIPTIGANGTIFRKKIFVENPELMKSGYLFDMDILEYLSKKNGPVKFAKVDVGIVHLYCRSSVRKFAKKQLRRVKDFLYREPVTDVFIKGESNERTYTYGQSNSKSLAFSIFKFILSCVLVVPLLYQSIKGYIRKPDWAWFAHPFLCWITLLMYGYGTITSFISRNELSRENWNSN